MGVNCRRGSADGSGSAFWVEERITPKRRFISMGRVNMSSAPRRAASRADSIELLCVIIINGMARRWSGSCKGEESNRIISNSRSGGGVEVIISTLEYPLTA